MFDGGIMLGYNPTNMVGKDIDLLSYLAKIGINKACLVSYEALYYSSHSGNISTQRFCAKYPNTMVAVAVINPKNYQIDSNYLEQLAENGFRMLCLAPKIQNFNFLCFVSLSFLFCFD